MRMNKWVFCGCLASSQCQTPTTLYRSPGAAFEGLMYLNLFSWSLVQWWVDKLETVSYGLFMELSMDYILSTDYMLSMECILKISTGCERVASFPLIFLWVVWHSMTCYLWCLSLHTNSLLLCRLLFSKQMECDSVQQVQHAKKLLYCTYLDR